MAKIKKTLTSIGIWLALQIVVTVPFAIFAMVKGIDAMEIMAPALLISDALVILVLWFMKYYRIKELFSTVPFKILLISLVLGCATFYAIDILSLPFNLPDIMSGIFKTMAKSFWGFLAICIIGPVMEEIMMRRVILTEISEATGKKWIGIIVSAAIFAIVHGNPIQIFFAMPAGILLGWIYCKTGSLLVPICIHIMNNTVSFISIKVGSQDKMEFSDPLTIVQLALCIIVAIALIIQIAVYYSRKEKQEAQALAQTEQTQEITEQ